MERVRYFGWVTGLFLLCGAAYLVLSSGSDPFQIDLWHGDRQSFGHIGGHPQRWINVLGNISPAEKIAELEYSLNGGALRRLSFHEDQRRLASNGDFNVEILRSHLRPGTNSLQLTVRALSGEVQKQDVSIDYVPNERGWPLPYTVNWTEVEKITDVVQVVDGKWALTEQGIRVQEPYYDRVVAFGDESWTDYEVETSVTIHAITPPSTPPNNTRVTHAAIALRWPGHDPDGEQPSVKWYPLGATAEFRLGSDLSSCRWRIFDGKRRYYLESNKRRSIEFEKTYALKHRVETLPDGTTRYRVKLWPIVEQEPKEWDLERYERGDLPSGSALLLGHHADVTFGNIKVVPL